MSAHVSHAGKQVQASNTGSATVYTAPASNVTASIVTIAGEVVFVGWYDSTGNTLHGEATLVGSKAEAQFGPMASGDILVAVAYGADATFVVGEIY